MRPRYLNILFIFLFLIGNSYAQQAEIAVSTHVEGKVLTDKEINDYANHEDNSGHLHSRYGKVLQKNRDLLVRLKEQIRASQDEIITRLGKNNNVRFVREFNNATTNFVLRFKFSLLFDEIPLDVNVDKATLDDGTYSHGIYYIKVFMVISDPHTNHTLHLFKHRVKYSTNNYWSSDEIFNNYWELFLNVALPRANAEECNGVLEPIITYGNARIKYKPKITKAKPKADGKQKGKIIITDLLPFIKGEAKSNSITKFILKCEKGKFLETNSKEIEFTGADYYYSDYGGSVKYETKYQAYDCKDYEDKDEKGHDTFTLTQVQVLSKEIEEEIKKEDIDFDCERLYDIYATYDAPNFAKAKVVYRNTTIRFPEKGEKIQEFDVIGLMKSGDEGEPLGTDGKPLKIPYSMMVPGSGKETLYGWPENEFATPEVLSVSSAGGYGVYSEFKIVLNQENINNCNISQLNEGPVFLDFSFELRGRYPKSNEWRGEVVWCVAPKLYNGIMGKNSPFPVNFSRINFTDNDIEKFKAYEEFEKTLSNGRATLKIEFKQSEE